MDKQQPLNDLNDQLRLSAPARDSDARHNCSGKGFIIEERLWPMSKNQSVGVSTFVCSFVSLRSSSLCPLEAWPKASSDQAGIGPATRALAERHQQVFQASLFPLHLSPLQRAETCEQTRDRC